MGNWEVGLWHLGSGRNGIPVWCRWPRGGPVRPMQPLVATKRPHGQSGCSDPEARDDSVSYPLRLPHRFAKALATTELTPTTGRWRPPQGPGSHSTCFRHLTCLGVACCPRVVDYQEGIHMNKSCFSQMFTTGKAEMVHCTNSASPPLTTFTSTFQSIFWSCWFTGSFVFGRCI